MPQPPPRASRTSFEALVGIHKAPKVRSVCRCTSKMEAPKTMNFAKFSRTLNSPPCGKPSTEISKPSSRTRAFHFPTLAENKVAFSLTCKTPTTCRRKYEPTPHHIEIHHNRRNQHSLGNNSVSLLFAVSPGKTSWIYQQLVYSEEERTGSCLLRPFPYIERSKHQARGWQPQFWSRFRFVRNNIW